MKWGQPFRVRHVTTGRYLALTEEKGLVVVDAEKANTKATAFCFRISKVRRVPGCGPLHRLAVGQSETPSHTQLCLRN